VSQTVGVMGETEAATSLDNAGLAFGLVICAGLSTAVGAAAVFQQRIVKLASKPVLAAGLGFSGGVMLYVSFIEIFFKSNLAFAVDKEENDAYFCATLSFFSGMVLLKLLSMIVHRLDQYHHCEIDATSMEKACGAAGENLAVSPDPQQPASSSNGGSADKPGAAEVEEKGGVTKNSADDDLAQAKLQRMGINTAAAIAIHNFPEGLATFVATLADPAVGVTLAIAIGIHNIPEGLCVALPIYYATGSRLKGFLWALLSGLSEPVGALIGYAIIKSTGEDMNQVVYGILFGLVGGMMVMIVVLELLPTAYRYDPTDRFVTNSVVCGMLVMALSLCLFMA